MCISLECIYTAKNDARTFQCEVHKCPNAKIMHVYENSKLKLCKCTAAIWYNKTCKLRHLTPRYSHITINGNNPQCRKTKLAAIQFRLQQEIKFLYVKKQHLIVYLVGLYILQK